MRVWLWSGATHFVIGFVLGWIVFQRPAFVTNYLDRAKAWVRNRTGL